MGSKEAAQKNVTAYIIQSQEDELKRIAGELHEGVGQTLYSIYTGLGFIKQAAKDDTIKGYVGDMAEQLEKTIQEIRMLAVELHPPALTSMGIIPAMKSYLKLYTSTFGVEIDFKVSGEEMPLSYGKRITLFRVCQEALANIARYADTAKAEMTFTWGKGYLAVSICDQGKGFDVGKVQEQSMGLAAMRERMQLIGGEWTLTSSIGAGTAIDLYLPI